MCLRYGFATPLAMRRVTEVIRSMTASARSVVASRQHSHCLQGFARSVARHLGGNRRGNSRLEIEQNHWLQPGSDRDRLQFALELAIDLSLDIEMKLDWFRTPA